ncbi:hypothetical protein BRARA_I02678 [Brassica rapa]|uniref:Uncharacterized protein n=1 Tax=Brassica campestris TaxID=3711 RepID=A0A397XYE2_BRACM|nr:hypothetical protein BRARA_I02678 [Brassica rapa]
MAELFIAARQHRLLHLWVVFSAPNRGFHFTEQVRHRRQAQIPEKNQSTTMDGFFIFAFFSPPNIGLCLLHDGLSSFGVF